MKTINISPAAAVASKGTKEEQNNFNHKITIELAELFGINNTKNNIHKILIEENDSEVNSMEEQLAELFGKTEDFKKLKNPLTIANVLKQYEKYESNFAA